MNDWDSSGLDDEGPPTLTCTIGYGFFYGQICEGYLNSLSFGASGYSLSGYFAGLGGIIAEAEAQAQSYLSLWTTSNNARNLLTGALEAQAVSSNSNCMGFLETETGKSFNQLMQDANQLTFVDVTGVGGSLTMSQVGLPGGNETLAQYFSSADPTTVAATPLGYPVVLLGSNYFNSSGTVTIGNQTINLAATPASQAETLFHEFFHTEGIGDLGGSTAFDGWLQGGCKGTPPGQ